MADDNAADCSEFEEEVVVSGVARMSFDGEELSCE